MSIEKLKKIESKIKTIKAIDIMSKFAITTTPDTSIDDLSHLLMRFKISGVPVIDKNDKLLGIVTATDLFNLMKDTIKKIDNPETSNVEIPVQVKSIMTESVFTIKKNDCLYDILKLMYTHNIHTLPVVENETIIGIVGRRDVVNAFFTKNI